MESFRLSEVIHINKNAYKIQKCKKTRINLAKM